MHPGGVLPWLLCGTGIGDLVKVGPNFVGCFEARPSATGLSIRWTVNRAYVEIGDVDFWLFTLIWDHLFRTYSYDP